MNPRHKVSYVKHYAVRPVCEEGEVVGFAVWDCRDGTMVEGAVFRGGVGESRELAREKATSLLEGSKVQSSTEQGMTIVPFSGEEKGRLICLRPSRNKIRWFGAKGGSFK